MLIACDSQTGNQNQETEISSVVLEQVWATEPVLKTPESVLYHPESKILYVSNINGVPSEKDGNGFISKLTLDGAVEELEWAKGLNAPKGMAISSSSLFVTDIDELVEINLETGEIVGRYPVEGATFLNDATVDNEGVVYFSGSESGKIFRLNNKQVEVFMDSAVAGVNGLLFNSGKLLALVNGDQTIKEIDIASLSIDSLARFTGHGDGIVIANDSSFLISNWEGQVFYWTREREPALALDTKEEEINSADIEYIPDENLLLVPTFFDDRVVAYRLTTENLAENASVQP